MRKRAVEDMNKLIEPNYTSVLLGEDDQDNILCLKKRLDRTGLKTVFI